jgi:hypothetical protein
MPKKRMAKRKVGLLLAWTPSGTNLWLDRRGKMEHIAVLAPQEAKRLVRGKYAHALACNGRCCEMVKVRDGWAARDWLPSLTWSKKECAQAKRQMEDIFTGFRPPKQPKLKRGERRASAESLLASLGGKKGSKRSMNST